MNKSYDVIVFGSDIGGVLAATYLSRKNYSVLLLRADEASSAYEKKGFSFLPFSNLSEKLVSHRLCTTISRALDLDFAPPAERAARDSDRSYQILLPCCRIDLLSRLALAVKEWEREFRTEVDSVERFYGTMSRMRSSLCRRASREGDPLLFPAMRRSGLARLLSFDFMKPKIDSMLSGFSKPFAQFIRLQLLSRGNLYSTPYPAELAAYLLAFDHGSDAIEEKSEAPELESVKDHLIEVFIQFGGAVREAEDIRKVEAGSHRRDVLLTGNGASLQSRLLLFNLPLHRIPKLLGRRVRRISHLTKSIRPCFAVVPVFLGIREKVVPVGMKNLLVSVSDPDGPLHGGNLLFLSLSPRGDGRRAPEGKRALTVESLIPSEKMDSASLMDHQRGVMGHLIRLFPYLEDHVEFAHFVGAAAGINCESHGHYYFKTDRRFSWRKGIIPSHLLGPLYFTGREVFPYLGLEGDVLSGLKAAQRMELDLSSQIRPRTSDSRR